MRREFWSVLIVIGALMFCLSLFPKRAEVVLRFLLRMAFGVLAIYCLNQVFDRMGSPIYVGINGVTVGAVSFLGLPGFVMLYALAWYFA